MSEPNLTAEDVAAIEAFSVAQVRSYSVRLTCAPGGGIKAILSRRDDSSASFVFTIGRSASDLLSVVGHWDAIPQTGIADKAPTMESLLSGVKAVIARSVDIAAVGARSGLRVVDGGTPEPPPGSGAALTPLRSDLWPRCFPPIAADGR